MQGIATPAYGIGQPAHYRRASAPQQSTATLDPREMGENEYWVSFSDPHVQIKFDVQAGNWEEIIWEEIVQGEAAAGYERRPQGIQFASSARRSGV